MKIFYISLTTALIIFLGVLAYNNLHSTDVSFSSLEEYHSSIDYSCVTSSDCKIKDTHNCCGYQPRCVNKNAKVNPDFVDEICKKEGLASGCGWLSINYCECVQNKCEGKF